MFEMEEKLVIICYLAPICPVEVYKRMKNQNSPAAYYFNKNLAEGFATLNDIEVISPILPGIIRRVQNGQDGKIEKGRGTNSFGERESSENGVRYINLYKGGVGGNYGEFCIEILRKIRDWKRKNDVVIICDTLSVSSSFVSILAQCCFNIRSVGIVTDLPQYLCESGNFLKRHIYTSISLFLMRRFHSHILLTKKMGDVINKKKHFYCIVEGICNPKDFETEKKSSINIKEGKKVCLYAGSLHFSGILMLIKGFINANIPNTELRIYGDGDAAEKIKKISEKNKNIFYGGTVPRDIIIQEEKAATLLINPRPTNREYVKYSFPSKTIEYMASGTPLLTTKLPGMPMEYYRHVYFFEDETVEGYTKILREVLGKKSNELFEKGKNASRFILEKKNNKVQAERIFKELRLGNRN